MSSREVIVGRVRNCEAVVVAGVRRERSPTEKKKAAEKVENTASFRRLTFFAKSDSTAGGGLEMNVLRKGEREGGKYFFILFFDKCDALNFAVVTVVAGIILSTLS